MDKKRFHFRNATYVALILFALASLTMVVSCNKEKTAPQLTEQEKWDAYLKEAKNYSHVKWNFRSTQSNKAPITVDFSNPDNPFDYVGALHNQGLDYFIDNYQGYPALIKVKNGQKEFSLHEMWKIIGNFGRDNNIQGLRQLTLNPHFRNTMNQEIVNNFPNLATQLSPLAYNYLQSILQSMPKTDSSYTHTIGSTTVASSVGPCPIKIMICKDYTRNIENQILNDVNLSSDERAILLMSASVARHSYAYWTAVWMDSNDKWWKILNENPNSGDNAFINPIVVKDVAGAIWGGVSAYVAGNNVVTGAVLGAIGASIAVPAIVKLIDWIF